MKDGLSSGLILPQTPSATGDQMSVSTLLYQTELHNIYLAQSHGRRFVLKGIRENCSNQELLRQLLYREYELLLQLENPYIARVWDYKEIDGVGSCIIMEFVDGANMEEWVAQNPNNKQRRQVMAELLDAIRYLHSKQIVHGDLKPQNILITADGNHVKLIDVGLADKVEFVARNLGYTLKYAAPEQKSGQGITNRTDIYALGYILRLLFPRRYRWVARRCTQPLPEKRYESVDALSNALRRSNLGAPVALVLLFVALLTAGSSWFTYTFLSSPMAIQSNPIARKLLMPVPWDSIHLVYDDIVNVYIDSIDNMPYLYQEYTELYYQMALNAASRHRDSVLTKYPEYKYEIEQDYMAATNTYLRLMAPHREKYITMHKAYYEQREISQEDYEAARRAYSVRLLELVHQR